MSWLDPGWEPSSDWDLQDRLELAAALLELVERDVYAGRYSLTIGRPNFTSIHHVLRAPGAVLERARESAVAMLQMARAEHADAMHAQVTENLS